MNKEQAGNDKKLNTAFWSNLSNLNKLQKKEIVQKLLQSIDSKARAIVSLFYFEKLDAGEIQYVMNCSREQIHNTLKSFSDSLRETAFQENKNVTTVFH
jgi:DNA-directed RNA polymerase specialized sigma24 family protein